MNSKLLYAATLAVALASTLAVADDGRSGPLTREQVLNNLHAAQADGNLQRTDYDYDRHVGGAVYLFLRGHAAPTGGLHLEKPPRALMEALDRLFSGQGGVA